MNSAHPGGSLRDDLRDGHHPDAAVVPRTVCTASGWTVVALDEAYPPWPGPDRRLHDLHLELRGVGVGAA